MGMKNRFQEAIQNVQRQRHLARRSVAMVLVLAMLTAMSVSWRLHQDGIALAADDTRYYCGKEEHKHTDDCYIEGTEPICGYEEGEIVEETMDSADDAGDGDSSAADWDEAGSEPESEPATQEEPEPEVVLHHHTADCYEEEEVLTCGIESDHVHQDYCYDQETGELLCTEHEHTDDCYTLEEVLVCGQEEGEPEKTDDGAALYDTDENSAEESDSAEEPETVADPEPEQEATKPETDAEIDTGYTVHHHTAECYGKVLICGKEEHEHTAACLVNPNAEIDAEYDAKTPDRTSVDWAQDMVLVARSQLGYTESKADVDEDGNGYTMYADQYYKDKPMVYADWDSTFVAYCLYHAGVPQDIIPQYASISALRGELARMNSEYYTDDPQEFASILPGDIVMYKNAEGRETIGVVSDAAVDEETDLTTALTVISGDVATGCESDGETTIDQVAEVSVALNEVTSFVSVNAAEGYGISDLVEDDQAVESSDSKKLDDEDVAKITGASVKYFKNGQWTEIPTDYIITVGDRIQTWINFTTNANTFKDGVTKLTYQLPYGLSDDQLMTPKDIMAEVGGRKVKIGTLTVDKNGLAALDFDFSSEEAKELKDKGFDAYFWVEASAELGSDGKEGKVKFPGKDYWVTIKNKTDISVKKNQDQWGDWQDQNIKVDSKTGQKYLEFTVNVDSVNGTGKDLVTITDSITDIADALKGDYDKNCFVLKDKDGNTIDINGKLTIGTKGDKQYFEIKEIPAMSAGDRYTLTYRYNINSADDAAWPTGHFRNDVYAKYTDKEEPEHSYWEKWFQGSVISKSGNYNWRQGRMDWTITVVKPDGVDDLAGYVIKDTLKTPGSEIINGKDGIRVWYGDSADKCNSLLSGQTFEVTKPSETSGNLGGFKYVFPAGSTNKYYKITYSTTVPDNVENKSDMQNDVEIDNKDGTKIDGTTGTGTVDRVTDTRLYKSVGDLKEDSDNKRLTIPWNATIVPENPTEFTMIDKFMDLKIKEEKNPEESLKENHYAILGELKAQLEAETTGNTSQGIHIFTRENDEHTNSFTYNTARKAGMSVEITYYSDNEQTTAVTDENARVRSFKIEVKQGTYSYQIYQMNVNVYTTYVDIRDPMQNGKNWEIRNELWSGTRHVESRAYYQKEPKKDKFEKKVSNASNFNNLYNLGDNADVGYKEDGNTTFWYELWLEPGDFGTLDETSVTDTLPEGLEYAGEYHAYFHAEGSSWGLGGYPIQIPEVNVKLENLNNKQLTFSLSGLKQLDKKNTKAIAIFFKVKINDPDFWKDASKGEKKYTNKTSWRNIPGEATATVKRGETFLEKTGKQNANGAGNTVSEVTYYVTINKDGKDLVPDAATVTLADKLTLPSGAVATLKNTQLYTYSEAGENHCGSDATADKVAFTTRVDGNDYYFDLTVPDDKAYVFEYTYTIDTTNIGSQYFDIQNSASLFGRWKEAQNIQFVKVTGGGGATGTGSLTLKKVQRNMWDTFLSGTQFELMHYDAGKNHWIEEQKVTTDSEGKILFASGAGTRVAYNTLYKLQETKAPDGYVADADAVYYFILVEKDGTEEQAFATAGGENAGVSSSAENLIYVEYGKNVELRVENSLAKLSVEKQWKYANGEMMSEADKADQPEVVVEIYQYDVKNGQNPGADTLVETVTLNKQNNWKADITLSSANADLRYYAVEKNADSTKYTVTYWDALGNEMENNYQNGDTIVVVNQLKPTSLTLVKKWFDKDNNTLDAASQPDEITVNIYKVGDTTKELVQTVMLRKSNNWMATVTGLEPDANYYVEEVDVTGFTVAIVYNGEEANTSVVPGGTVTITNTEAPTYELPSTGSPGGTVPYTAGGAAIALAAVLCGYNSRRKRKRGEE